MYGSVRSAWGLLWRHQRLLWWIFAVNLVLAWLGSLSVRATLSAVIGHSLAAAGLVQGFDVGTFLGILGRPDVNTGAATAPMFGSALIMLIYLLFIDGGLFAVYLEDRKLSRAEFFENSGLYFWRMLRLALYSLPFFGIVAAVNGAGSAIGGKLSNDAAPERLGFFVQMGGLLLAMLLGLVVRLWFDLTQARVVHENERRLLRTLFHSFRLVFSSGLYLRYLGIGVSGLAGFAAGVWLWLYVPHRDMIGSFAVWEIVVLWTIATRLWMKASSARWVALQPAAQVASTPFHAPPPEMPEPVVEAVAELPAPPLDEEPPISE
jgi:hypothetical protein